MENKIETRRGLWATVRIQGVYMLIHARLAQSVDHQTFMADTK